jgi:threonine/homoserine/homoserine lactone efflux protein
MEPLYSVSMLLSVVSFAIATAFTLGLNNLMLLSSGLTFGYKRTLPHILGIVLGFPIMKVSNINL